MRRYELSDIQWDQIQDLFPFVPDALHRDRGRPRRRRSSFTQCHILERYSQILWIEPERIQLI